MSDTLRDVLEALLATVLLGIVVAGAYRLFIGEIPWTFFIGELVGLCLGVSLLLVTGPRRRRS